MPISYAQNRRRFLQSTAGAFAALAASGCTRGGNAPSFASASRADGATGMRVSAPLVEDPNGILDLQEGFSYRVISRLGDTMTDGLTVPDRADGMGCFDIGNGEIALVRNHELSPGQGSGGAIPSGYQRGSDGAVLPGGTTTIVLDKTTLERKREFRSLAGTIRNCAGGITPWGSWLTCEEPGSRQMRDPAHGYVFEVPAGAPGLVDAQPLKAMGRFNHEAACVDPATGIVYMTEDSGDGLLYRFLPNVPGELARGGRLQAAALADGTTDSSNHNGVTMKLGRRIAVRWIDLDNVESPENDLRLRGAAKGALKIARGEGMHMGDGEVYFCSTSGGAAGFGQVFRLTPGLAGASDMLELFFESENKEQFDYGDNLVVTPFGDLIVCEDQYTEVVDNRLIGITAGAQPYVFGRLRQQTELAGGCFSPDGKWFFVNAYSPTLTFAITGPWNA